MYNNGFRPLIQKQIPVAGTKGIGTLKAMINSMVLGNFISEHDAVIAEKVALILSGGYVPSGTLMSEEEILSLEREAFISLVKESKTVDRMKYMLSNNRPLRN
jgi:3-hydroxyacyl-CoA dehydrogenase